MGAAVKVLLEQGAMLSPGHPVRHGREEPVPSNSADHWSQELQADHPTYVAYSSFAIALLGLDEYIELRFSSRSDVAL